MWHSCFHVFPLGCHVKIVSNDNFREYIGNVEDFDFSETWVRDHVAGRSLRCYSPTWLFVACYDRLRCGYAPWNRWKRYICIYTYFMLLCFHKATEVSGCKRKMTWLNIGRLSWAQQVQADQTLPIPYPKSTDHPFSDPATLFFFDWTSKVDLSLSEVGCGFRVFFCLELRWWNPVSRQMAISSLQMA